MLVRLSLIVVMALLALVPTGVFAGEGRIPIFEPVELDGSLGDISGRYVLTRNIAPDTPRVAIHVIGTGSEELDIDLNGFTIQSNAGGNDGILISNVRSVRIHGGGLRGAPTHPSILAVGGVSQTDKITIEDVKISGGTRGIVIAGIENVFLRRNQITETLQEAIVLEGDPENDPPLTGLIVDNVIRGTGVHGIAIDDSSRNMLIRDNQIEDAASIGILVGQSKGVRVIGNAVSGASGRSYSINESSACSVIGNTSSGAQEFGMVVINGGSCIIEGNLLTDSAFDALIVENSDDVTVRNNVLVRSAVNGLYIVNSDRCVVRDNQITANGDYGLHFHPDSSGGTYGGNTVRGNGGTGCGNPGTATCGGPDLCDDGVGTTSFGDNLTPGPPPC